MKTKLLFAFLFCSYFINCKAQELQGSYIFNTYYKSPVSSLVFKEGYKVRVIDTIQSSTLVKSDSVQFRVYNFTYKNKTISDTGYQLNQTLVVENNDEIIVHIMERSKFNKYTSRVYSNFRGVRAGFYTIPFKIRVDDFDFEQNINFGMNIGFQFRFNRKIEDKWLYEPAIGIGLSSINLNSKNSNVTEDRSAGAFTASTGIIIHFDKNINLGVFYGLDFLGNNDTDVDWKYNKKPWLGIGINIGFSLSESKGTELTNKAEKP